MWFNLILIIVLIICVLTDIKERRIYNKVIFPSLLLAFLSHLNLGGWQNLYTSLIGFGVGFGLLFIPYFLGGIGAGDVKLLALIGALKGPSFVFYTSLYMAIAGGIIAFILLFLQKRLHITLQGLFFYLYSLKHGIKVPSFIDNHDLSNTYPYGIAIAIGAFVSLVFERGL
ncbi:A24 family peptidase [Marinisporobacter balticus]|uniref:Prepilin peptidase CpaA n=1 Tax=Marinisporobacter balticus TaxID=2018667 RepID=A0A4R2L0I2_9FIRM|nr:prepilin peptidase [Marinisporobacter balticus]TCO78687.1 prepilin peptidase CpaA [Marinisporobacter balticus]